MSNYAILLDLERCLGCSACVVACQAGNELPAEQHYISIREEIRGEGMNLEGTFLHERCYHCADAACVDVCPTGALYKQDGLTALNVEACSGCGYCVEACPYGIPKLINGRAAKCTGCTDLIAAGEEPYCVQTCPSQALTIGDREAMVLKAGGLGVNVYGLTQYGGLGLLTALRYQPESVGLPQSPAPLAAPVKLWQDVVQPASAGLSGLALAATAGAFIIARRNHHRELEQIAQAAAGEAAGAEAAPGAEAVAKPPPESS